ncbi:hypothetical protein [Candidatus Poriferisodalis sp.]
MADAKRPAAVKLATTAGAISSAKLDHTTDATQASQDVRQMQMLLADLGA